MDLLIKMVYKFHVNFSNSTLSISGDNAISSISGRSAILTKNGQIIAQYNGVEGTGDNGGGNNGGDAPEGNITYTINSLPTWITDHGCVIYSWVWGGNYGDGCWIPCEFTSSTSVNLLLDGTATGMLLVRCVAGTVTPNWAIKGNEPGRIYNQTNDIALRSGVTTYSCSSWKDYNP